MSILGTKRNCGNCYFFEWYGDTEEDDEPYGFCMRFPPVYTGPATEDLQGCETYVWKQPAVSPKICVCGEWKPTEGCLMERSFGD